VLHAPHTVATCLTRHMTGGKTNSGCGVFMLWHKPTNISCFAGGCMSPGDASSEPANVYHHSLQRAPVVGTQDETASSGALTPDFLGGHPLATSLRASPLLSSRNSPLRGANRHEPSTAWISHQGQEILRFFCLVLHSFAVATGLTSETTFLCPRV
jgi:hypothetical protein